MQQNTNQMVFDFYKLAEEEGIKMTEIEKGAVLFQRTEEPKMRDYSEIMLEIDQALDEILTQALKRNFSSASGWAAQTTKLCIELSLSLKKM